MSDYFATNCRLTELMSGSHSLTCSALRDCDPEGRVNVPCASRPVTGYRCRLTSLSRCRYPSLSPSTLCACLCRSIGRVTLRVTSSATFSAAVTAVMAFRASFNVSGDVAAFGVSHRILCVFQRNIVSIGMHLETITCELHVTTCRYVGLKKMVSSLLEFVMVAKLGCFS